MPASYEKTGPGFLLSWNHSRRELPCSLVTQCPVNISALERGRSTPGVCWGVVALHTHEEKLKVQFVMGGDVDTRRGHRSHREEGRYSVTQWFRFWISGNENKGFNF